MSGRKLSYTPPPFFPSFFQVRVCIKKNSFFYFRLPPPSLQVCSKRRDTHFVSFPFPASVRSCASIFDRGGDFFFPFFLSPPSPPRASETSRSTATYAKNAYAEKRKRRMDMYTYKQPHRIFAYTVPTSADNKKRSENRLFKKYFFAK